MKLKNCLLSTLTCTALLTSHLANAIPVPPAHNWTGLYVGVNAGYGWANDHIGFHSDIFPAEAIPEHIGSTARGGLFGFQVGFNNRIQNNVVGLEFDFDWTRVRTSGWQDGVFFLGPPLSPVITAVPFELRGSQSLQALATFRGRAGVLLMEPLLAFLTAGFADGETRIAGNLHSIAPGFSGHHSYTHCQAGFVLGGGLEYGFGPFSAKAEYLFYDLSSRHNVIPATAPVTQEVHFKGRVLRVGLNYTFG